MPRYVFHFLNDTAEVRDEDGGEFDNVAAALANARRAIGEIIAEEITRGSCNVHVTLTIAARRV